MNEVYQSIQTVTNSPFFWFYMGLVITFGMTIGVHLDDGMRGFKRSMTIIFPFSIMVMLTTLSRLYEASQSFNLTSQAYNGTTSFLFAAIFYSIGLFIGHLITCKAKEAVAKGKYDTQRVHC